MGALHEGHASLISRASSENEVVVVSIFVNPTQFNSPGDLEKYPRSLETDLELIEKAGGNAVFVPEVTEMYPKTEKGHWDFGIMTNTLEGFYRPGHFDGVLTVVKKLFRIVEPDRAYFGEKDFQQLALIKKLVSSELFNIEVISCPSVRESSGLAMSSRNRRLNEENLIIADNIYRVLTEMKHLKSTMNPEELLQHARTELTSVPGLKLEYLELADANSLEPVIRWQEGQDVVALTAVYVGDVRLIDNLRM